MDALLLVLDKAVVEADLTVLALPLRDANEAVGDALLLARGEDEGVADATGDDVDIVGISWQGVYDVGRRVMTARPSRPPFEATPSHRRP